MLSVSDSDMVTLELHRRKFSAPIASPERPFFEAFQQLDGKLVEFHDFVAESSWREGVDVGVDFRGAPVWIVESVQDEQEREGDAHASEVVVLQLGAYPRRACDGSFILPPPEHRLEQLCEFEIEHVSPHAVSAVWVVSLDDLAFRVEDECVRVSVRQDALPVDAEVGDAKPLLCLCEMFGKVTRDEEAWV